MNVLKYLTIPFGFILLMSCASQSKAAMQGQEQQITAANARTSQLESQIGSLKSQIAQKSAEIDALNAKIGGLQKANTDLQSNLDSLRAGETGNASDYLSQIDALKKDNAALQDQIANLQKEKAALDMEAQKSQQDMNDRIAQLRQLFSDEIASGLIDIKEYRDVLIVSVQESVFFVPDWPTLLPGGEKVLQKLAEVFKKAPDRIIRVEGNTAVAISSPESLKYYPTSWHLGAARAANVVNYLQEKCGMDPMQLVATSFGQFRPIADNSTEVGKAKNRRVDFILVSRALWELDRMKEAQVAQQGQ